MGTMIIYDLETDSFDTKEGEIIELAYKHVDIDTGKVLSEKSVLFGIPHLLPDKIIEVTGITDSMLAGKLHFSRYAEHIKNLFESANVICGHNIIAFDNKYLKSAIKKAGFELSLPESFDTIKELTGGKPKKLGILYRNIFGYEFDGAHRARADVDAVYQILLKSEIIPPPPINPAIAFLS